MATTRRGNIALWIVQGLLTCLFLFTGGLKLFAPLAMLRGPVPFPGWFYRFLGAAELCGALGLILPGALRTQRALTPIAAVGLTLIVTGATVITLETMAAPLAVLPFVTALLTASVAYGRRDWLPLGRSGAPSSSDSPSSQP